MNKNLPGRFYGALVLLAVAPQVGAQQAPRCSDLYDDAQRLACYDAAFGKPARPSSAAPGARAPASASTSATPPAVRATPVPAAPPAAAAPAAPVAQATPRAAGDRKNVSATISDVSHRADGRFVVTLDNGQVWSQLERDSTAAVATGDQITVRPGVFGSNILITRAGMQVKVTSGR